MSWLEEWAKKEEAAAVELTAHLMRILNEAETKDQKVERKQLLKEIKVLKLRFLSA